MKEINGDNVIVLSSSLKMLIFAVKELPLLKKGKGVRLQRYKGETLLDAMIFSQNEKEAAILKKLFEYKIDIICLAGFMKVLSKKFLVNFNGDILNIHPSILPSLKGLNTHKRVIENNEKYTGCTIHYVNRFLDF